MKNRWLLLALVALALFAADLVRPGVQLASAQDVQITGPLAGAPAVRRMRVYREGRLMLQPGFSVTLQDEFTKTMFAGLDAAYHFTDWLGVGVWFGYGVVQLDTSLTDEIGAQGVTTDRNRLSLASREGFSDQIGTWDWGAALTANFIPLRGKLALFQKLFVDTDFFIQLGVGFAGISERDDVSIGECAPGDAGCFLATQTARQSRLAIAPVIGAGINMYFNDYIGLNVQWRGMPFSWNRSGTDESGSPDGDFPDGEINSDDRIWSLNHMFQIGLVVFLPTSARITE